MKKRVFEGSAPALVTPFKNDGIDIDFGALEKILDFQLKQGSDAVVTLGTTGEPSTMTDAEKKSVIEFVIKHIRHRVPVIVGTGGNCTQKVIDDSIFAEKAGADALLIVSPYYNKATQNGLVAHYHAVANKVGAPIIVYNVPARTGLNITAVTLAKIAEHKNIAAIKEASGNMEQVIEIASLTHGGLDIYSGDDALTLPILSAGGAGLISVSANIAPNAFHILVKSFLAGEIEKARELQLRLYPLIKTLFLEVNPIPVKTATAVLGLTDGSLRLPLTPMEQANKEKMLKEMKAFGLIK
jgi:4-hydroxy-tetrahydrodipicolinate synthase